MLSNRLIRHIDDLGRIAFPIANLRPINLNKGDLVEITLQKDGAIVIRKYKKSWEDTVIEWWEKNYNRPSIRHATFTRIGDYTFCVLSSTCIAGFAKRYVGDKDDDRIGKVAAYARALGIPINKLIGWKG